MKLKLSSSLIAVLAISFCSCSNKVANDKSADLKNSPTVKMTLNESQARQIFELPIHCLAVEFPNKLGQVLGSKDELKSPKELRPIFYGCFDWHSSVHGFWSVVELMQKFPSLDADGKVRALLNEHITPENVAIELAFFNDVNNKNFERTYGWAWLFKLQESLSKWNDADAQRWKANLQPLTDLLVERYTEYLPKLVYPIRAGQHDNSAFGLSLSLDYARSVGDKAFENVIIEHGMRLFQNDVNCDLAYEPSGYDFLSPCLEEAYFMAKILDDEAYKDWLKRFMPELFNADFTMEPAIVKDRTDGKLVHLDGLNYSRAACLYGISTKLAVLDHLAAVGNKHITFSLLNLSTQDDYMGSNWLGTLALYALSYAN